MAGSREDGGWCCKGRRKPWTKGLAFKEPSEESWRWGQSWIWKLQTETQQMDLAIQRGHLGGPEAGRVMLSEFQYCIAICG